jgi:mRNA interferase RelE/StbE
MAIYQSKSFAQKVKKMRKQEKEVLDQEVQRIAQNTSIGEEKKGDLTGVFVHKFTIETAEYLLAYRKIDPDLELVMIGPHENYYRDLNQYLKNR